MNVYNVNSATVRVPRTQRLVSFLILLTLEVSIYFAALLATHWLWHWNPESRTLGLFLQSILFGFVMSIMFYFLRPARYQILVDDEEMSTDFNSRNHLFSRTVRRGEVKTLIQRRHGLLISQHNRIGTYFWGGVWVPKELADYEYLKRLAISWKASSAA